jgi:multicomponent Na+:H+ antiporter subunit G
MATAIPQLLAASGKGGHPVLDALSAIFIVSGMLFFLGATVGIVRFPDFYTRMHAAGKGDTLSTVLITTGMAIQVLGSFDLAHWTVALVAIKILAIGGFIMLTSPTSTHALMKAGFDDGIEPEMAEGKQLIQNLGGPFLEGVEPQPPAQEQASAQKKVAKKAAAKRATKKKAAKRAASKKVAKKKAAAKNTPTKKEAAKKVTSKKAATKKAAKKAAKKAPRRND